VEEEIFIFLYNCIAVNMTDRGTKTVADFLTVVFVFIIL